MVEEEIEIRTADGVSDGFIFYPEGKSSLPGVLLLTDIGGIRPAPASIARRLAEQGYIVEMPNVFYRSGKPPMFDAAASSSDELRRKRFAELSSPLNPEAMERDAASYVDFLARHPSTRLGAMGVVGFCFTGSLALRTAAAQPDRIAAAASFHGGGLYTDAPNSPHLVLPEAVEKLRQALEAWGGEYESEVYEGAFHGWTVPDSPVYNPPQAERAFEKLSELFSKTFSGTF